MGVEEAPGRLLGSLAQQSLAARPDLPQWLHFTGCGQSRAMCPRLPQLWQVLPSEPCFGPVATCTLLSRSLVSLIRVWYATTDSQTLATVVAPQVKLHKLCYLVWQVSQVEKVLIPLSDAQVSQLTSDQ